MGSKLVSHMVFNLTLEWPLLETCTLDNHFAFVCYRLQLHGEREFLHTIKYIFCPLASKTCLPPPLIGLWLVQMCPTRLILGSLELISMSCFSNRSMTRDLRIVLWHFNHNNEIYVHNKDTCLKKLDYSVHILLTSINSIANMIGIKGGGEREDIFVKNSS